MRRIGVWLTLKVDLFDPTSEEIMTKVLQHVQAEIETKAQMLSLRTIRSLSIESMHVTEIK